MYKSVLFVVLFFMDIPAWANSIWIVCSDKNKKGDACEIAVGQLRPTQGWVGDYAAEFKTDLLMHIADKRSLKYSSVTDFLKHNLIPVIKGPNCAGNERNGTPYSAYYMVDGHHLTKAVWNYYSREKGIYPANKSVYVQVIHDYTDSELICQAFWLKMQKKHYVYLKNPSGISILPQMLPLTVNSLKNASYRSIAGLARKLGYFKKPNTLKPFYQFDWAVCLLKSGAVPLINGRVTMDAIYQAIVYMSSTVGKNYFEQVCHITLPARKSSSEIAEEWINE